MAITYGSSQEKTVGANNWRVCPNCKDKAILEQTRRLNEAESAYGTVSAEEYLKLRQAAEKAIEIEDSLREDWEIGLREDGLFFVSYGASCEECGFKFTFSKEEPAWARPSGRSI
jgi:predicted Zn-ribbon and HTH transcriptional regulator